MAAASETAPISRVAMVEDDRDTRARLAASICAQGSLRLVAEYATGAEALAGLDSSAPDVLLVDLGLPDISGLEVVRFAAGRHPDCDIFDIQDIRNGGSPLSPVIARQVLKRLQAPGRESPQKKAEAEDETTLTTREGEILNAISRGFSYAETAQMLGISVGTVHTFLKRIYRKLAVHSKTEAVFEANRLGLIR